MSPAAPGDGTTTAGLSTVTVLEAPPGAADTDGFTSPQLCSYARITFRQCDFWSRTGRLTADVRPATGSGTRRLYSRAEADVALTAAAMIRAGLTVDAAFTAARTLLADIADRPMVTTADYSPRFVRLNGPLWLALMP